MDFIINELSANFQYATLNDLINQGLRGLSSVLTKIREYGFSNILKKTDFWQIQLLPGQTLQTLCFSQESRRNDAFRKIKSQIASFQNEPFWDLDSKQKANTDYFLEKEGESTPVNNSGIAEAYERSDCLISFCHGNFDYESLNVKTFYCQESNTGVVANVWNVEILLDVLFKRKVLDMSQFIKEKFNKKLNFEGISEDNGLNLINAENYKIFYKSFQEFEQMTWNQIKTSDAFDYKSFKKNRKSRDYFSLDNWNKGIYKFRIDSKIRCFGYVDNQVFHMLRIDLDHVLSDKG